jgi:hypothetical protein
MKGSVQMAQGSTSNLWTVLQVVLAAFIASFLVSMLGWIMFYHSCMKIRYAGHDSYELQFPAYLDTTAHGGYDFRDSCIRNIESYSEVVYAFWGAPGVFTTKDYDDYIYIAFKDNKHRSKEEWQKIIDKMCERKRNEYRPKIGDE